MFGREARVKVDGVDAVMYLHFQINCMYDQKLDLYDKIVGASPNSERKGKTMPYTSANGYMYSLLNKDGEIGIRLPKERQKEVREVYDTGEFRSHGAVMRDYVLVPDSLASDIEASAKLLEEGFEFVMSLPPK